MTEKLDGSSLVGGKSRYEKPDNDFYATDPDTVRLFMERAKWDGLFRTTGDWWEPACGNGNISRVLCECIEKDRVYSSDVVDRGWKHNFKVADFLSCAECPTGRTDVIITNPPFSLLNGFIEKGMEMTGRYLVLFAKIQTLETVGRRKLFDRYPPSYVYVHSERQSVWRNGEPLMPDGRKWSTTMCMAWFVWDKQAKHETILRFL